MRILAFAAALLSIFATIAVAQQAGRGQVTPNPDIRLPPFAPSTAAITWGNSCAGCHGTNLEGTPKGRSLFRAEFLADRTDNELVHSILTGFPAGGMPAFKGRISEALAHQLVYYMRIQSGRLAPRPPPPDPNGLAVKHQNGSFRLEVLAAGLDVPWGIAFLPDAKTAIVTERGGKVRFLDVTTNTLSEPIRNTPKVFVRQDAGMLDVALHPDYARNGWVYLGYVDVRPGVTPAPNSHVAPNPAPPTMTVIVRGKVKDGEWTQNQEIFRAPGELYTQPNDHYGIRFLFDRQNRLYWSLGDRHFLHDAQDLSNPIGKIHRVLDDGRPAPGNPFFNTPGAMKSIWSYGHRNPQGLAWSPLDGRLWETEHGPTGGDEINVIRRGANYGWGKIARGLEPGVNAVAMDGMEQPKAFFNPAIGPGGITFYTGNRYSGWKNSLFITGMTGQKLFRLVVKGDQIISRELLLDRAGRVRDVKQGPDGLLYILLQNPTGNSPASGITNGNAGMVVRLVPTAPEPPSR
jgi:glucose/arabinose dehydrogenase